MIRGTYTRPRSRKMKKSKRDRNILPTSILAVQTHTLMPVFKRLIKSGCRQERLPGWRTAEINRCRPSAAKHLAMLSPDIELRKILAVDISRSPTARGVQLPESSWPSQCSAHPLRRANRGKAQEAVAVSQVRSQYLRRHGRPGFILSPALFSASQDGTMMAN